MKDRFSLCIRVISLLVLTELCNGGNNIEVPDLLPVGEETLIRAKRDPSESQKL